MPKCPFCKLHTETGSDLQDHLATKHPEEILDTSGSRFRQQRKFKREESLDIVVDGNNVIYSSGKPIITDLKKARAVLMKEGYRPTIFVSSALRYDIDQPAELNRLINVGWLIEVDGGEDDDVRIIEEAYRKKCCIVSNDNFKEYSKDYKDKEWNLSKFVKKFSFENGKFVLD